jgi:hypothetical protein
MSVRISGLLLGAALALTITVASAQVYSANECRNALDPKSPEDLFAQGFCAGTLSGIAYTGGALELRNFVRPLDDDVRRWLCVNAPATAPVGKLVRVVIAYIEARPERMHEDFRNLALDALREAWPCK